jgi:hypothetical protein
MNMFKTFGRFAALFALGTALVSPLAAQQPPAKPPAKPATPAPAPAAPAMPAPTLVQLKAEPSQQDWLKVCGEDQAAKKKVCYTTRDFVSDENQPVIAVAVYDVQGEQQKVVRFLMPLGLLIQTGIRFAADQGASQPGRYAICFPNGCFAEGTVKDDTIAAFKKANSLSVNVQNQFGQEVSFQVPMAGFGKAFDGAPIDPAVLEAQQKKLEEQMQKQAEEMRQKMQQQQGAAPAPGGQPAPAPKQ